MKNLRVLIFISILGLTIDVNAQWTTSGSNIYNSNSGNVGIGTVSPSYKLDVSGTWALRQNGFFYNSTAYAYESSTNQYLHFRTAGGKGFVGMESSSSLIIQSNGGKVGIGVTNPGARLEIATDSGYEVLFSGSDEANIYSKKIYSF